MPAVNQPSRKQTTPPTLGVIIGNRDFFPDVLVGEARKDLVRLFEQAGIRGVMLTPEDTKLGGVETKTASPLKGGLVGDRAGGGAVAVDTVGPGAHDDAVSLFERDGAAQDSFKIAATNAVAPDGT